MDSKLCVAWFKTNSTSFLLFLDCTRLMLHFPLLSRPVKWTWHEKKALRSGWNWISAALLATFCCEAASIWGDYAKLWSMLAFNWKPPKTEIQLLMPYSRHSWKLRCFRWHENQSIKFQRRFGINFFVPRAVAQTLFASVKESWLGTGIQNSTKHAAVTLAIIKLFASPVCSFLCPENHLEVVGFR